MLRRNPIPELQKGRRTGYKSLTEKGRPVVSEQRQDRFRRRLTISAYSRGWGPKTRYAVYYAIGSGQYWVGAVGYQQSRYQLSASEGAFVDVYNVTATIQSGPTWDAAEKKVYNWFNVHGESDDPTTGSGALDFLRFVQLDLEMMLSHFGVEASRGEHIIVDVEPTGPKKEAAYTRLRNLGFEKQIDPISDIVVLRREFRPSASTAKRNPSVWEQAQEVRTLMWPRALAEGKRIQQLTGYEVSQQNSFRTALNLPDSSDLDMALIGLNERDFDDALRRVMSVAHLLGSTVQVKNMASRPGYLVSYVTPDGFPVDLQIRRQVEIDHMEPAWSYLEGLPAHEKRRIVETKYKLRNDKAAYKKFKSDLYSRAGFLSDWSHLK